MPKIRTVVECGYGVTHTDTFTVPDEEWAALSDDEKEQQLQLYAQNAVDNATSSYAEVVE